MTPQKFFLATMLILAMTGGAFLTTRGRGMAALSLTPRSSAQTPQPATPRVIADSQTQELMHPQNWADQKVRDEFAWRIFAAISASETGAVAGSVAGNHDVVWERWADNIGTFIPVATPKPAFPDENLGWDKTKSSSLKHLQIDPVLHWLKTGTLPLPHRRPVRRRGPTASVSGHDKQRTGFIRVSFAPPPAAPPVPRLPGQMEEVRRNEIAFHAIVDRNLWLMGGFSQPIADFQREHRGIQENVFEMPSGSIQIKAYWTPLPCNMTPAQCATRDAKYHTGYDSANNKLGLVAMHIMAKVDKQWIWATWEWAGDGNTSGGRDGNPGRCDYVGCTDRFGVKSGLTQTNPQQNRGQRYKPEPLSADLLRLFHDSHLGPEWNNYRLKGTQLDSNTPRLLGSSIIESSYVASSSCVTCHNRASVSLQGDAQAAFSDVQHPIFRTVGSQKTGPTGPTQNVWFTHIPDGQHRPVQVYFRTDSVWSFVHATQ